MRRRINPRHRDRRHRQSVAQLLRDCVALELENEQLRRELARAEEKEQ